MKKTIVNSLIALFFIVTTSATVKAQKGFYIGAQGAPQLSVMWNEDDIAVENSDYKSKFSMTFGLSGGFHFTEKLAIGTELMYAVIQQQYLYDEKKLTQQFNYLKVPVLFSFNTDPSSKVVFTAKAGPQVGFLLNSRIKDATESALNGDNSDAYRKTTFGAMAGAAVRVRIAASWYLEGGLRIDGTISDTENKDYDNYTQGRISSHDFNAGLELGVKYFF